MSTPAKFITSLCLAAGIFVAGYMANRQPAPVVSYAAGKQVLYYTCPMHPQYKSDHPGDAPCCGMRLVAVYAGGAGNQPDAATPGSAGTVQVSASSQQLIGVRTDEVGKAPAAYLLRVPGRITVDDERLYRLIAAADGWIRELGHNPAGTFVKKDQVLASYYTPNFQTAQQGLLFGLDGDRLSRGETAGPSQRLPSAFNPPIGIDRLRSLGMSDLQIDELQQTRQFASEIRIYSPISGFVLARNISPGQRFDKGTEMFRIADIGHLWVMTDIFENDREFVRPGSTATVRYRGREFAARMSDALQQLDGQSRTLKTRFELDNAGLLLRPDMFVDVEVQVNLPAAITVPADAVIDSGRRRTVYVDRGSGLFEPRLVKTGWRMGDRVQVTEGLEVGEHVVVSGNFLIDSESRMKPAAAPGLVAMAEATAEKDPVCGMNVDPKAANAIQIQHGGNTYTFCSPNCKKDFEAAPQKFVPKKQPVARHNGSRGTA